MYPSMSILEIEKTTLAEYEVLLEAYNQRFIDDLFLKSYGAWQNNLLKSVDKNSKPVYRKFTDLFNYDDFKKQKKEIKKADDKLLKMLEKINS